MANDNGTGKGIVIDLNRVTALDYMDFMDQLEKTEDRRARYDIMADFNSRVVTAWPYEAEISPDGYKGLGFLDSRKVDDAVTKALTGLKEKN